MFLRKNIVICGSGIAGISTAYHLAVKYCVQDILIIDQFSPLSLTSDQSSECFRNWWPGPDDAMVRLMNHSLDIMESLAVEIGNVFNLDHRGYLYLTEDCDRIPEIISESRKITKFGAGPLRIHQGRSELDSYQIPARSGYQTKLWGADLITHRSLIQKVYPFLSRDIVAALHVRRAGWLSAQQLGMYLLEQAKSKGVQYLQGRIEKISTTGNRIESLTLSDGSQIKPDIFINAAGPFARNIGRMMGADLPIFCELHHKVSFKDHLDVIPRDAPLLIWMGSQHLPWSGKESEELNADAEFSWMLNELPAGVHTRPEGGPDSKTVLMLWEYRSKVMQPEFPIPEEPFYTEIILRGLKKMIPGINAYIERTPRPVIDGGYYTKTRENRPLIGPLPVKNAYIIGALSGFGIMAACGAGDLLASIITGGQLPDYAPSFSLDRYKDPIYLEKLTKWGSSGQL